MEVRHLGDGVALSFHPAQTVPYNSFRAMITRSRCDASFGPFLSGIRFCIYPQNASQILAVRDACIYDGTSTRSRVRASSRQAILSIAGQPPFAHIAGFKTLVDDSMSVLDRESPGWFERSHEILCGRGVPTNKEGGANSSN